jgi:hypothetical protein
LLDKRLETVFSPRFNPPWKEAAALLKIASHALYRLARKGMVLSTRIGIIWRFSRTDLEITRCHDITANRRRNQIVNWPNGPCDFRKSRNPR